MNATLGTSLAHGLSHRSIRETHKQVAIDIVHGAVRAGKQKRAAIFRAITQSFRKMNRGRIVWQEKIGGQSGKDKNASYTLLGFATTKDNNLELLFFSVAARNPKKYGIRSMAEISSHCLARMYQTFGCDSPSEVFEKIGRTVEALPVIWLKAASGETKLSGSFAFLHPEGVIISTWDDDRFIMHTAIALTAMSPAKREIVQDEIDNDSKIIKWTAESDRYG